MVRIKYSDGHIKECPSVDAARYDILNQLFNSHGYIFPLHAVEIFGHTSKGVPVERELTVKFSPKD